MSGPAHGVLPAIGHDTETSLGAAAVPSVATRTLISSGSCSGAIRRSSCWNSSSHRSDPIGLRASTGAASAAASPSVSAGAGVSVASPSATSSSGTAAGTASETISPSAPSETSL